MWDWISFLIGVIIGIIVIVILVWIAYQTRILIFSNCPTETRQCVSSDYFNDPGDALANGANLNEILFIVDNEMMYRRFKKVGTCVPGSDQVVVITNPQYCLFTIDSEQVEGKSISFNNFNYTIPSGTTSEIITTSGDCVPTNIATSGTIELKWDPNPIPC